MATSVKRPRLRTLRGESRRKVMVTPTGKGDRGENVIRGWTRIVFAGPLSKRWRSTGKAADKVEARQRNAAQLPMLGPLEATDDVRGPSAQSREVIAPPGTLCMPQLALH